MTSSAPALEAIDLTMLFNDFPALDRVNLTVEPGETVCILGPSGSGKSTLLRCLSWIQPPSMGEVHVGGERIGFLRSGGNAPQLSPAALRRQRARIGFVFQSFNLWPHRTALGNVTEGLIYGRGLARAEAEAKATVMLARVGLEDRAGHYPAQLSGGQQQRVAIARALAMEPEVLLFDEPTSALDPELVGEVLDVMQDLARQRVTMVVVTHEVTFAAAVADRIVFMDSGRIVESAPPATFFTAPQTPRARAFIEGMRAKLQVLARLGVV
jgi:polar amino acid transport system ATP-binding protein